MAPGMCLDDGRVPGLVARESLGNMLLQVVGRGVWQFFRAHPSLMYEHRVFQAYPRSPRYTHAIRMTPGVTFVRATDVARRYDTTIFSRTPAP